MTSFNISLPADPRWLHLARAATLAGVSAMSSAHVDFLDDATIAIGESILEVAVTPGVEDLEVRVDVAGDRFSLDVTGSGTDIEYDEVGGVFQMVLGGLVDDRDVRRSESEYAVRFSMTAPGSHG